MHWVIYCKPCDASSAVIQILHLSGIISHLKVTGS